MIRGDNVRSASTTPRTNNMLTNSPSHVSAARPELITHMFTHRHKHRHTHVQVWLADSWLGNGGKN